MYKNVLNLAILASVAFAGNVMAKDLFLGQTGQYHTIPDGQDVQEITLFGQYDGKCAGPNDMTLYPVDEFGHMDTAPFIVPTMTVFLLTDAAFSGHNDLNVPGSTPWLNIGPNNAAASDKASFIASKAVSGSTNEPFAGSGSLASGAAFATNSKLCARVAFAPQSGPQWIATNLDSVVVHGTLIDNIRTDTYPYLGW